MKKIIIDSTILRNAVNKLQQAIPRKSFLPVLNNLHVQISKGIATLTATDLELTIICRVPCESNDSFKLLLPFEDIKRIVLLYNEPLVIEINDKKETTVLCGEDFFNLGLPFNIADFPPIDKIPNVTGIPLDDSVFQYINIALLSSEKDVYNAINQSFANALLHFKDNFLNIVCTDAKLLFRKTIPVPKEAEELFIQVTPKIAGALKGLGGITMFNGDAKIIFQTDSITVIGNLPVDKYPNYQRVIPNYEFNSTVSKSEIQNALLKCAVIGDVRNEIIITTTDTTFRFESRIKELNKASSTTIDVQYSGACKKIAVNGNYLLTLLKQVGDDVKELCLSITGQDKVILIMPKGDDSMLLLLAPIQFID